MSFASRSDGMIYKFLVCPMSAHGRLLVELLLGDFFASHLRLCVLISHILVGLKCHYDQKIISYFPSDFESVFA